MAYGYVTGARVVAGPSDVGRFIHVETDADIWSGWLAVMGGLEIEVRCMKRRSCEVRKGTARYLRKKAVSVKTVV